MIFSHRWADPQNQLFQSGIWKNKGREVDSSRPCQMALLEFLSASLWADDCHNRPGPGMTRVRAITGISLNHHKLLCVARDYWTMFSNSTGNDNSHVGRDAIQSLGSGLRYLDFLSRMGPWRVTREFTVQPPYITSSCAETQDRKSFPARKTASGSIYCYKRASSVTDTRSTHSV